MMFESSIILRGSNFKSRILFIDFILAATSLSSPLKQFFTFANGLVLPSLENHPASSNQVLLCSLYIDMTAAGIHDIKAVTLLYTVPLGLNDSTGIFSY